jgi:hypothetical protein
MLKQHCCKHYIILVYQICANRAKAFVVLLPLDCYLKTFVCKVQHSTNTNFIPR